MSKPPAKASGKKPLRSPPGSGRNPAARRSPKATLAPESPKEEADPPPLKIEKQKRRREEAREPAPETESEQPAPLRISQSRQLVLQVHLAKTQAERLFSQASRFESSLSDEDTGEEIERKRSRTPQKAAMISRLPQLSYVLANRIVAHTARGREEVGPNRGRRVKLTCAAFIPGTSVVVTGGGNSIVLTDCEKGEVTGQFRDSEELQFQCLAVTPAQLSEGPVSVIAAAGDSGSICVLVYERRQHVFSFFAHYLQPIYALAFVPVNGAPHPRLRLLSGSKDKSIHLWELLNDKLEFVSKRIATWTCIQPIYSLAVSPAGSRFASGGEEYSQIWNAQPRVTGPALEFSQKDSLRDCRMLTGPIDGMVFLREDLIAIKNGARTDDFVVFRLKKVSPGSATLRENPVCTFIYRHVRLDLALAPNKHNPLQRPCFLPCLNGSGRTIAVGDPEGCIRLYSCDRFPATELRDCFECLAHPLASRPITAVASDEAQRFLVGVDTKNTILIWKKREPQPATGT